MQSKSSRYTHLIHYVFPGLGMELKRRGQHESNKVSALCNDQEGIVYMKNQETHQREHEGFRPEYFRTRLQERGIWVKTTVRFEPALKEFDSEGRIKSDPQDPLLVIRTLPLDGQYFPYKNTTNRWANWHVSICFKSDGEQRHAYTDEDLSYLVHKFDNKELQLRFSRISNWITSGDLDVHNDPIASDPVVQRVHRAGWYGEKPLHISF